MSKSTKKTDKAMDSMISQFVSVTGAPVRDARRYLEKYQRVDLAVDAYYNEPTLSRATAHAPSTSKLNQLFDKYKDPHGEDITVNGTINMCQDLGVDPEDVVLLSVAYELKSPRVGEWTRKGWVDGWKEIGCDALPTMKTSLLRLRDKLGSDPTYFQQVYNYTFDFARMQGQRSLALDTAQGFWGLLLPHGLQGGALAHISRPLSDDEDEDDAMVGVEDHEEGWKEEYTQWWFDFLEKKGGKGVSKDTWQMFLEFVRTIDAKFEKYDMEAAWPSMIDDFVIYAKERIALAQA